MDRLEEHIKIIQRRAYDEARLLLKEKPGTRFARLVDEPDEPLYVLVEDRGDRALLMALGTGMRLPPATVAYLHEIEYIDPNDPANNPDTETLF